MLSKLEKELFDISEEILYKGFYKGVITLQKSCDLYFEAKGKYLISNEKERTRIAEKLMLTILFRVGKVCEEFISEWQKGKFIPNNHELSLLKEGCNEVEEAFDNLFQKELLAYQVKPFSEHHAEVKQKISKIRKLIQQGEFYP
jgi:hypothetical protein